MDLLTPPRSPNQPRSSGNWGQAIQAETPCPTKGKVIDVSRSLEEHETESELAMSLRIECPFEFDIRKDENGRPVLFGEGAWSKVYKATSRRKMGANISAHGRLTPPGSPPQQGLPLHIAVKAPLCKSSKPILQSEAEILSHIQRSPGHDDFVVPFYGFVTSSDSIVLEAIPMSLSEHITSRVKLNKLKEFGGSGLTCTDPILGSTTTWLDLASSLVEAIQWLHETAGIVHGDIKPANILLSPKTSQHDDDFPYTPLLIDFSSSHVITSASCNNNTPSDPRSPTSPSSPLSAITREYTAPELLSPSVLRDPSSRPTTASDIFSLAVTLLVCATGDLMVYSGNVWQRQHMATQGWGVLDFVRNGASETGLRVPLDGVVERVLAGAVRKVDQKRISAEAWSEVILAEMAGGPA